ncbi:hypothetical protein DFA_09134 [Cavenderia fasciculata]|uniref:Sugar transporter SWEET1 n=1 Tax=Cavenderia fasciculata TaxID=261658 RepID=F4Q6S7_CACFS|nr:uncharacterized protein DFA_09134 [Cavenderia fasciculata]EGG16587.1 hypothetical protein DFA_09134 [Cavenderia fasciculata]|eukprot:XP_004354987.1 hypothetical protein DFA_09134 [Cavenderia fasciculata]
MTALTAIATILSVLGNILSTLLALSPIKQFIEIDKKRDVGKMNILPIIFLSANSMMWIIYGMVTKRLSILPVNTFGLLITLYFVFVFYGATPDVYAYQVIKKRDVSTMNYPLALMSTIAATCWTFYGILVQDPYIIVPNGAGAAISFTQLVVYFLIKKLASGYSDHLNLQGNSSPTFISESQHLEMDEDTPGGEI